MDLVTIRTSSTRSSRTTSLPGSWRPKESPSANLSRQRAQWRQRHGQERGHVLVRPTFEHLETVEVSGKLEKQAFRMPVQWVNDPTSTSEASAHRRQRHRPVGDELVVAPSGTKSKVARIVTQPDLTAQVRVRHRRSRGRSMSAVGMCSRPPRYRPSADQFGAHIVWMQESPLPGTSVPPKSAREPSPVR